jgi:hypothetical protein
MGQKEGAQFAPVVRLSYLPWDSILAAKPIFKKRFDCNGATLVTLYMGEWNFICYNEP